MAKEKYLGAVLASLFNDFKVVRINPCDDTNKGRLQLCQPEEYAEMVRQVTRQWDPTQTLLELGGPRLKLQRAVRQMFFFDGEHQFEKVLLEGYQGIDDFPWAVQILMVWPSAQEGDLRPDMIKRADVVVVDEEGTSQELIDRVKTIRPDTPVFTEEIANGFSSALKEALEDIFTSYLEKRKSIKAMLTAQCPEPSISCEQARQMAGKLRVSTFLFGNVCDECGYSITHCGFGCF